MSEKRGWDIGMIFICVILLLFGIARAKHDLRWSSWAGADADTLNAALHFSNEGFREHYFMPYVHPGFLGKGGISAAGTGYYIRYPSFSQNFNGLLIRLFGEDRFLLKSVSVLFATLALFFSYLAFQFFFTKPVAFLASLFIGTSVGFLQLIDCLSVYMYSECFRFLILFLFLFSEKIKEQFTSYLIISGLLWITLFIESYNSFDYYIFLQLFFWLYYWLSERRLPWKRVAFLSSAPLLSFAVHKTLAALLLQQYQFSSTEKLFSGFLDKTYPFHHGFFAVIKSIPYFFRIMEGHMVNSNFGFGFAAIFLMTSVILLSQSFYPEEIKFFLNSRKIGDLKKILLLFFVPSISWWVIFPNHTVTFSYTPIHAAPLIALLFSLCINVSVKILKSETASVSTKIAMGAVLVGCLWNPLLMASKYFKEYPNLLDTTERQYVGIYQGFSSKEVEKLVSLAKKIGEETSHGDIIVSIPKFLSFDGVAEYYAQRRIDSLEEGTKEELLKKIKELKEYRMEGAKIYKRFNPQLKILVLAESEDRSETHLHCQKNYKLYKTILGKWNLYNIDGE